MQTKFVAISFVELTLWSVQNLNAQFPVERAKNDQWIFKRPDEMLLKPTVASLTQKVRQGLKTGLKMLGFDNYLCSGLNRQVAGIVIPVDGVLLSIPADVHVEICNISNRFFSKTAAQSCRLWRSPAKDHRPRATRHRSCCARCTQKPSEIYKP